MCKRVWNEHGIENVIAWNTCTSCSYAKTPATKLHAYIQNRITQNESARVRVARRNDAGASPDLFDELIDRSLASTRAPEVVDLKPRLLAHLQQYGSTVQSGPVNQTDQG